MDYVNLFVRSIFIENMVLPISRDVFLPRSFQNGKNCSWTWTCSRVCIIDYRSDQLFVRQLFASAGGLDMAGLKLCRC